MIDINKTLTGIFTLLICITCSVGYSQSSDFTFKDFLEGKNYNPHCLTDEFKEFKKITDKDYLRNIAEIKNRINQNRSVQNKSSQNSIPCNASNTKVIPIAVHYDNSFNCSNTQCLIDAATNSISALNTDFAATNSDISLYNQLNTICSTGYPLSALGNGTCLSFCLATKDHPTSEGITEDSPAITIGKYTFNSGASPWSSYLNVFVESNTGGLGVANAPGQANGDGVQIDAGTWGGPGISCSSGIAFNTESAFNLGRTLTHEIGHYLDLDHTFWNGCSDGDSQSISGTSQVNDTPATANSFSGCPNVASFNSCADVPQSCSGAITQFTNYMDYTDDACMVMFSQDQSTAMNVWANGLTFKSDVTACGTINPVLADCSSIPPPTCSDGIQNGDETGIDCGGSNCSPCTSSCNGTEVTLVFVLDDYSYETSWEIANSTGTIVASGSFGYYETGGTFTECLADGCYDFTISDYYGDGICCYYGNGSYTVTDENGVVLASGGEFTYSETTNFCVQSNACQPSLNISGLILSNVYVADDFITSNGQVNSGSNGSVTFNAGANAGGSEYIELTSGFDCDGTVDFEAINIECDPND